MYDFEKINESENEVINRKEVQDLPFLHSKNMMTEDLNKSLEIFVKLVDKMNDKCNEGDCEFMLILVPNKEGKKYYNHYLKIDKF